MIPLFLKTNPTAMQIRNYMELGSGSFPMFLLWEGGRRARSLEELNDFFNIQNLENPSLRIDLFQYADALKPHFIGRFLSTQKEKHSLLEAQQCQRALSK